MSRYAVRVEMLEEQTPAEYLADEVNTTRDKFLHLFNVEMERSIFIPWRRIKRVTVQRIVDEETEQESCDAESEEA